MQTIAQNNFITVKTEGGILPAELLQRIADGQAAGMDPADYHLPSGERPSEAINRAWNRLGGAWQTFQRKMEQAAPSETGTTLTREWLLTLLQELGYGRLPYQGSLAIESKGVGSGGVGSGGMNDFPTPPLPHSPIPSYPISHLYDHTPIHLISFRQKLDTRDTSELPTPHSAFRIPSRSPHSLLQEFLNRSDNHLWGFVSNGLRFRILRDNVSLTRAAYVEFDLEAMFNGELYSDFSLFWLLCHQSRVEIGDWRLESGEESPTPHSLLPTPSNCWLEKWSQTAAEQGTRALDALRDGVQEAITALGRGFLAHPANRPLRDDLQSGALTTQDYYRQLLRLVYRLLFLFVAEDRDLLLVGSGESGVGSREESPTPYSPLPTPHHRQMYGRYYSISRLRRLAETRRGGPHPDLYLTLTRLFTLLRGGYAPLALPGLGGFLFSERATPDLDAAQLANQALLDTIRALAFTTEGRVRRPVDYKNMGSEELGSVYESLLELHPRLHVGAATFSLDVAAGSERKTTGSYYTPASLIQSLLDTALEPVVADRLRRVGSGEWGVGSKGVGSGGVGSKEVIGDERNSIISRFESVAGRDEIGGDVLRDDAGISTGRTVRNDIPDQTSSSLDSSQHRGGVWPRDAGGLHSFSEDQPGVFEGIGDVDSAFLKGEIDHTDSLSTHSGAVQDRRRDIALADSQFGKVGSGGVGSGGVGSGGVGSGGVGSKGVGSDSATPPLPHSPIPPYPHTPPLPHSPTPEENAILSIKIVDPACGSGHFLIAAARRLARHLARARTGDDEPGPEAVRVALRDVVGRCIFGVDINEMAVELCKVALWMETLDPGRPLSFLDANIQCGNSLMGATPALLAGGIPDAAFTPITGDDKVYCAEWKRQNKAQQKQGMLLSGDLHPWESLGNLAAAMRRLSNSRDETLADVQAREEEYARLTQGSDYEHGRLWADAWCAAFVWVKRGEGVGSGGVGSDSPTPPLPHSPIPAGFPYPITEQVFRNLERSPHREPAWLKTEIRRLAAQYQFFHWHLAFPQVFTPEEGSGGMGEWGNEGVGNSPTPPLPYSPTPSPTGWTGGFDVVLGNPPWEKLQTEERQFFAIHAPEIAALTGAVRKKAIAELQKTDPALTNEWLSQVRFDAALANFVRYSGLYPLTGIGKFNTFALFAEISRCLQSDTGRVGIIVPSGIATDDTTKYYFQNIMDNAALVSLYDFENRKGIFSGVHRSYKFCLLTLTGPERPTAAGAQFIFFALDVADLRDEERRFTLSAADIALLNPNTLTCPIFRTGRDAELTKKIYLRIPPIQIDNAANPWNPTIRRILNETDDSSDFKDWASIQSSSGSAVEFGAYKLYDDTFLRVYEAKMMWQYDHRYATYAPGNSSSPISVTHDQLLDQHFVALPRYWYPSNKLETFFSHGLMPQWTLVFRRITNVTNERTIVFSILPEGATGTLTPTVTLDTLTIYVTCFLAEKNSFIFDYVARQKISGTDVNLFKLKQLPSIPPEQYNREVFVPVVLLKWLVHRVLELIYTAYDLRPFAQDCGYHGPPFRWDEERRFLLRCELDAAYFHLYGIERDDVAYIMDTFPIVRRKEEAAHGEYRTKRVILEMYDEMAVGEWGSGGVGEQGGYRTRLEPPPAHPDVAHPWDEAYLGPELPREEWWQEEKGSEGVGSEGVGSDSPTPPLPHSLTPPSPLTLSPPPVKGKAKAAPPPALDIQPALVTDFTPPQGSYAQRLKRVMALGQPKNQLELTELIAALGDENGQIRWLAGASLVRVGGLVVVRLLAAYLQTEPGAVGREEALKALALIAETSEDEAVRQAVKEAGQ